MTELPILVEDSVGLTIIKGLESLGHHHEPRTLMNAIIGMGRSRRVDACRGW